MHRMQGKVALVTGAAGGIGRAVAVRLAAEGAKVVLADVQSCEDAAKEAGNGAVSTQLDVTDEAAWARAVSFAQERFGALHVLVNNAGIGLAKRLEETSLAEWRRVHAVNLDGVFLGIRAAMPAMRAAGGGSIVNVSSVAGIVGVPDFPAYGASKGAVRQLTKSVALEGARMKIRCNSVHPGFVDTAMVRSLAHAMGDEKKGLERLAKMNPQNRIGSVDEVAEAVLFLASDASSLVNGSELVVDGGAIAM